MDGGTAFVWDLRDVMIVFCCTFEMCDEEAVFDL